MRKTLLAIGLTVVGFIAVWRYQPTTIAQPASTGSNPGSTAGTPGPPSAAPGATATAPNTGQPSGNQRTVAGSAVDSPYGTVQVQATLSGSRITDVTLLQAPADGRSGRITGNAAPVLRQEALHAQSAKLDSVSGATYTSEAFARSLQAAIDSAGR